MKKIFGIFAMGIMMISCNSMKVVTDYDKSVDFSDYKSLEYYGWAEDSDKVLNRFDKERIEDAFADEFSKRGIDVVEEGKGDLIVSLYIVTERKVNKSAHTNYNGGYGDYYDYGPGYGWGGGQSTTTYHEHEYTEGTLIVSVYDAKKKELIWESIGSGTVDDDPKSRERHVPKSVQQMMLDYPVKALAQK